MNDYDGEERRKRPEWVDELLKEERKNNTGVTQIKGFASIVIFLFLQLGGFIWWASSINSSVNSFEKEIKEMKASINAKIEFVSKDYRDDTNREFNLRDQKISSLEKSIDDRLSSISEHLVDIKATLNKHMDGHPKDVRSQIGELARLITTHKEEGHYGATGDRERFFQKQNRYDDAYAIAQSIHDSKY